MRTTTTDDDFLQAIVASPEDDTVRLIYADWLDDHDQHDRAEFIRVQCALAGGGAGVRRAELLTRQRVLRERHDEEWAEPVRRLVDAWVFERGFIESVRVEARAFVAGADLLFRRAPVRQVQLFWNDAIQPQDRARFVPILAECGHLTRLRSLDLTHNYLGNDGVRALAVCEYLTGLTDLNLAHNHIGDAGARALADSSLLAQLRTLDLSSNDLGPGAVRTLSAALRSLTGGEEELPLRSLDLHGNRLGVAGTREAMNCPVLRRVGHW